MSENAEKSVYLAKTLGADTYAKERLITEKNSAHDIMKWNKTYHIQTTKTLL